MLDEILVIRLRHPESAAIEKQKLILNGLVDDCIKNVLDPVFRPEPQKEKLSSFAPRLKLTENP